MRQIIELPQPDDWHVHLRDGARLQHTVAATANTFARALVMPNLQPPLTTIASIQAYKARILKYAPVSFSPYFSLYITEQMTAETLQQASQLPEILGAKLYPAGATTNSEAGVHSIKKLYQLFEVMQDNNLVLQIHGETTGDDIFDREACFIKQSLAPIVKDFPNLRIVLEHISTKVACDFVQQGPKTLAATITIHHLLYNRNHLLAGGVKPHFYCLPILKRETDQRALQAAALSNSPKFFLGTDSAPHAIGDKESSCGCAGIYSAPYALALYAEFFEKNQKLELLEPFACHFGASFYQLASNKRIIRLAKTPQQIPATLALGDKLVQPIAAQQTIQWSQVDV